MVTEGVSPRLCGLISSRSNAPHPAPACGAQMVARANTPACTVRPPDHVRNGSRPAAVRTRTEGRGSCRRHGHRDSNGPGPRRGRSHRAGPAPGTRGQQRTGRTERPLAVGAPLPARELEGQRTAYAPGVGLPPGRPADALQGETPGATWGAPTLRRRSWQPTGRLQVPWFPRSWRRRCSPSRPTCWVALQ